MPFDTAEARDSYYNANSQYWQKPDAPDAGTGQRYADASVPKPDAGTGQRYADASVPKPDPVADYFNRIKDQSAMPDEARRAALRSQAEQEVQTQIAAINQAYATLISDERGRQQEAAQLGKRQVSGIGRLAGLGGSSVQSGRQMTQMTKAQEVERAAVQALQAKQAYEAAATRGKGLADADARFQQEQNLASQAQGQYATYMQSLVKSAPEAKGPIEVGGVLYDPVTREVILDTRTGQPLKATETQVIDLGGGKKQLINSITGETIKEFGGTAGLSPLAASIEKFPRILASLSGAQQGEILSELAAAGKDISTIVSGFSGLSEEQNKTVNALNAQFSAQPIVKDYSVIAEKAQSIENIIAQGASGPADLALVFEFMKALDPTSVVREAEYDNAAKSGNIFRGWAAKFNGYLKEEGGFMPENVKQQFLAIAKQKAASKKQQYDQLRGQYGKSVDRLTGQTSGTDYIFDFTVSGTPPPAMDAPGGSPGGADDLDAALGFSPVGSATLNARPTSIRIPTTARLAYVNNNPGNLRLAGQAGATQGEGGFARFASPDAGYQALVGDIRAKQTGATRTGLSGGSTLAQLIGVYAPPSENNTSLYVEQAAQALGVSPNTPIGQIDTQALARFIAKKESSTVIA
jgi:hypothetical protein